MMEEVMYGMMPSAKTESCSKAPPLNRFTNPRRPPVSIFARQRCTATYETPGVGITEPKRKSAIIERVKKIFRRRSGVRKAFPNTDSNTFLSSI
jgi:hypothetical protein